MPSASPQLLIETDVLAEYLTVPAGNMSLLRQSLQAAVCYTTMLNALELFRAARTERERAAVMHVLQLVRVLGFHARYAEPFSKLAQWVDRESTLQLSDRESLILGMAEVSRLAILTTVFFDRYKQAGVVTVLNSIDPVAMKLLDPERHPHRRGHTDRQDVHVESPIVDAASTTSSDRNRVFTNN